MLQSMEKIKGILLDLDGVLYIGQKPIEGAADAVRDLKTKGFSLAGVTNTTTQPRRAIAEKLQKMNIPLSENDILTPAALATRRIGQRSAMFYVRETLLEDFHGIRQSGSNAEFIVMGDIGGEGYPPETLKEIFEQVMRGSRLIALHKNRFWRKEDGLHLDLGTFVAAVEYATGSTAEIVGKPSTLFFSEACASLQCRPREALMVGDDVESDIGGAQSAGLKGVLVQTGKYNQEFVKNSGIRPDLLISTIADLPDAMTLL